MILSPGKAQPYGINNIEIIFKRSWHTHLKHSKPYTFILQKVNNPSDGFYTHLLFVSAIILIFVGLCLHRLSRLLRVNLNWLSVTTTDFESQTIRTRRENINSSKLS